MARKPTPDVVSKTAAMDLRIFTEPQFGASYGDQLAVAQAAEGAGGLWETPVGETFSFPGTHYPVTDSPALPKPVQSPRPPIIVGGHGAKRTPRLAATYADEFNLPFAPMADFTAQKERVSAACEVRDRDPATMTWSVALTTAMGADEAEFTRRADAILHTPDQLRNDQLGGTPEELRDRLGPWAGLGVQRVYLQVLDLADLDHIAELGTELIGRV